MKTLVTILLFSAAAPAAAAMPEARAARLLPVAEAPAPSPAGPGFCLFDASAGSPLGEEGFKAVIAGADVVYAGETHDRLPDHLAQLEALKALQAVRGAKVAVGFEMLNFTLQPVLDEYASGAISEDEFLKRADWQKEWGFDFNLYKPLFDFIREKKLKALALNLPKRIVSKIARVGLDGLSAEEKALLPAALQVTANERYIAYIRETFDGHGDNPMSGMFKFENYLAAMSAWNETMGARLAAFLNANPGYAGLAVAGSGHVIFNAGIPASVASRTSGLRHASFYPLPAAACPSSLPPADAGLADYVWYKDYGPGR
ncbi:MAG: ChaN family lipoprotein [Elusimicrobiales bacterium]